MRLLAITPPASVMAKIDAAVVAAWVRGGAQQLGLAVLLREPRADLAATLAQARFAALREALAEHGIPTLVSVDASACDRATISAITDASPALAGVQLRGDPSVEQTARWRAALGQRVLGRSCHGVTPTPDASVDYTCLAPVFAPHTVQPGVTKQAIGLPALRSWTSQVPRVLALGGVDLETAEACLAAGAWGLAGISLLFGRSADAQDNVAALRQVFARVEAGTRPDDHASQARQRR